MIIFAAICPHPPIIVPAIGGDSLSEVSKTVKAMKELSRKLEESQPDSLVIISPHVPLCGDVFTIFQPREKKFGGDLGQFGDLENRFSFPYDSQLASLIREEAEKKKIPILFSQMPRLDHGILVPLYYLTAGKLGSIPIVPIGLSFLDFKTHFQFGRVIQSSKKRLAIVASGDLSHRLTHDAPAGYSPRGKEFDEKLIQLLQKKDTKAILNMDPDLIEEAGECGFRSILILLGALEELDYKVEVLSYEGPFGVGYLVANFEL